MNKTILLISTLLLMFASVMRAQTFSGTWATAVEYTGKGDMPQTTTLAGKTLKQYVKISKGGNMLRLTLSNKFGSSAVDIGSVEIDGRKITFGKKSKISIAAGQNITSDVLKYNVSPLKTLCITTVYGKNVPEHATSHRGSRTTSYIYDGKKMVEKLDHWYNLDKIDVETESPVVAVLGNSITDGRGSTTNKQNRWTDFMAAELNSAQPYGVLNLGIGGNCVAEGGLSEPAMKRFDRDILGQNGISSLIIFEGTNDIGCSSRNYEHVADTLIACYKIMTAKAKVKGIKVYGATITPTKGNGWYSFFHEAIRQTVNEWIRTSGCFDGIIDFDALARDNKDYQKLNPEFSDDWLHLNPKGYEAMGKYAASIIINGK